MVQTVIVNSKEFDKLSKSLLSEGASFEDVQKAGLERGFLITKAESDRRKRLAASLFEKELEQQRQEERLKQSQVERFEEAVEQEKVGALPFRESSPDKTSISKKETVSKPPVVVVDVPDKTPSDELISTKEDISVSGKRFREDFDPRTGITTRTEITPTLVKRNESGETEVLREGSVRVVSRTIDGKPVQEIGEFKPPKDVTVSERIFSAGVELEKQDAPLSEITGQFFQGIAPTFAFFEGLFETGRGIITGDERSKFRAGLAFRASEQQQFVSQTSREFTQVVGVVDTLGFVSSLPSIAFELKTIITSPKLRKGVASGLRKFEQGLSLRTDVIKSGGLKLSDRIVGTITKKRNPKLVKIGKVFGELAETIEPKSVLKEVRLEFGVFRAEVETPGKIVGSGEVIGLRQTITEPLATEVLVPEEFVIPKANRELLTIKREAFAVDDILVTSKKQPKVVTGETFGFKVGEEIVRDISIGRGQTPLLIGEEFGRSQLTPLNVRTARTQLDLFVKAPEKVGLTIPKSFEGKKSSQKLFDFLEESFRSSKIGGSSLPGDVLSKKVIKELVKSGVELEPKLVLKSVPKEPIERGIFGIGLTGSIQKPLPSPKVVDPIDVFGGPSTMVDQVTKLEPKFSVKPIREQSLKIDVGLKSEIVSKSVIKTGIRKDFVEDLSPVIKQDIGVDVNVGQDIVLKPKQRFKQDLSIDQDFQNSFPLDFEIRDIDTKLNLRPIPFLVPALPDLPKSNNFSNIFQDLELESKNKLTPDFTAIVLEQRGKQLDEDDIITGFERRFLKPFKNSKGKGRKKSKIGDLKL